MALYAIEMAEAQSAYRMRALDRSSAILRKILKRSPELFQAAHLLGKIEFEKGNMKLAQKNLRCAIENAEKVNAPLDAKLTVFTDFAYVLSAASDHQGSNAICDRGLCLKPDSRQLLFFKAYNCRKLELLDQALHYIVRLLALDDRNPDALCERGEIYLGMDRIEDALREFERAVRLAPKFAYAHFGLAKIALQKKHYGEAEVLCRRALSLNPFFSEAHNLLGVNLHEWFDSDIEKHCSGDQSKLADALASYDRAIELKPNGFESYNNRGNTLREVGRPDAALASHNRALELNPKYARAFCDLGCTLFKLWRFEEALVNCDKAIELEPKYAAAYVNRGEILIRLARFDEALVSESKALELQPDNPAACNGLGNALRELGRFDEAIASYSKAIEFGFARARFNIASLLLQRGDFKMGFEEYEFRNITAANLGLPFVQDASVKSLQGKKVLITAELYFGDTIHFSRYAKLLLEKGVDVTLAPQKRLGKLISTLDARLKIIDADSPLDSYDGHIPMMSLPFVFRTEAGTIPGVVPYLSAEDSLASKWRERIGPEGFKIAVCWRGSDALPRRSFSLGQLRNIGKIPNVRLISLQRGPGEEEIAALSEEVSIVSFGNELDSGESAFLDSAAIISICDLVITCDTAVAHLAGALGAPVWLALRKYPEWRWMLDRVDSPWYPTMRLFRQKKDGEWTGVFDEIREALIDEIARNNAGLKSTF